MNSSFGGLQEELELTPFRKATTKMQLRFKKMQKARNASPHIVDIGEPPLPPHFHLPPPASRAAVFKGKGRRLADDDGVRERAIRIHDMKPTVKAKPAELNGRVRSKASSIQLAIAA